MKRTTTRRCLMRALAWPVFAPVLGTLTWPMHAAQEQRHPDVVDVQVRARGGDRFDFDVTVSSPYDTPRRYADGFRVTAPDGRVLGERKLLHDHQHEQPFTRDLHGVSIPPDVRTVTVQARDQVHAWGGRTKQVTLPGR